MRHSRRGELVLALLLAACSMTTDDNDVYWTSNAREGVWRVAKSGGAIRPLIGSGGGSPIVADGPYLYYFWNGVQRVDLETRRAERISEMFPIDLVQDETHLYWATSEGDLARWNKTTAELVVIATIPRVLQIAIDDLNLYVLGYDQGWTHVLRVPKTLDAPVEMIAETMSEVGAEIAAGAGFVYWASNQCDIANDSHCGFTRSCCTMTMRRLPRDGVLGDPPEVLLSEDGRAAITFLIDGDITYLAHSRGLEKMQLSSGAREYIVYDGVPSLTIDSTHVYWVSDGIGGDVAYALAEVCRMPR
jgi:hypothetical protein